MNNSKPKLLLIADVPGWIFERHCRTLETYLSDEFDITICYQNEPFSEEDFDLIYPLEWYMVQPGDIRDRSKYVTGIRSHLVWPELDFERFVRRLNLHFKQVHVVSHRLYKLFEGHVSNLHYVTHGVDTHYFSAEKEPQTHFGSLRIGWAGNRKSQGNKGFLDIIAPLGEQDGLELIFCGYSDTNLSMSEMKEFYESIDIYVCASENFEGNNNSLMEAASMARAIVTTDNGTVPEYLRHGVNALVVDRNLDSFREAINYLAKDRDQIPRLGLKARDVVREYWDWRVKVEEYRQFFWVALDV